MMRLMPLHAAYASPAAAVCDPARSTARWSLLHATLVLFALSASVWWEAPFILAVCAFGSFAWYGLQMRGNWTPGGRFGAANGITTVRLAACLFMLGSYTSLPPLYLTLGALAVLLMDGLDGYLARKQQTTGLYGATYDVEVDALYTAMLALLLVALKDVGAWVVLVGAWRYVYQLVTSYVPPRRHPASSTVFGRWCYGLSVVGMAVSLTLPNTLATTLAGVAALVTSASFLTSFWQRYAPTRLGAGT